MQLILTNSDAGVVMNNIRSFGIRATSKATVLNYSESSKGKVDYKNYLQRALWIVPGLLSLHIVPVRAAGVVQKCYNRRAIAGFIQLLKRRHQMENRLIEYFLRFTSLTAEEVKALTESMVIKEIRKSEFLVREGQRNKDTYFVLSGLVREFKLTNGEEITTNFFSEGQWIISLTSFTEYPIAESYLVSEENSFLVVGNEEKAQEIFKKFPRLETTSRAVMETVFAEKQKTLTAHLTETPEQRYLSLIKERPDILQIVPQYQIASYVGVKPESLSRIRKRIATRL